MTYLSPESCPVPKNDTVFERYHDTEWGVPETDDLKIFEKICLEGFQVGLKWQSILHRRAHFRQTFDNFNPEIISRYNQSDIRRLMNDTSIIRNRKKILSVLNNAGQYQKLRDEFGSLASFFWSYEPAKSARPKRVDCQWLAENPHTANSRAMAAELKNRGWSYIGPTNMYALMQALGIVNDHVETCPQRQRINILRDKLKRPV